MSAATQRSRQSVATHSSGRLARVLFLRRTRRAVHPRATVSAFALIAFYLSLPWIKINGYPAVFLDVAERRFHLFGVTLAAQDLWLLFFVITGLGFLALLCHGVAGSRVVRVGVSADRVSRSRLSPDRTLD